MTTPPPGRPAQQLTTAFPVEDDSGGELVGRSQQHSSGAAGAQRADVQTARVHRDRNDRVAAVLQLLARPQRSGVLDGDTADAVRPQELPEQGEGLRDQGEDMDTPSAALPQLVPGMVGMVLVGSSVSVSHALVDAPLFTAQAVRYLAATAVLVVVARLADARLVRPRGREWLWLAGLASTGLVLFNVAVVRGVAHAEPAVIAVAVACVPLALGVVGPLLERRRPSRQVLLAAPVVMAGAVLVEGTGRTDAVGVGWAAVALGCEAAFTLLAVPVLRRHSPWGVSVHATWLGGVLLAVLGVTREGPAAAAELTPGQWAAVGYLTVMVTAVAFVLWYSTVRSVGAGRAGLLTGIAPLSAAVVGAVAGTGTPGPSVWLGIAVVITGLVVGLRPAAVDPALSQAQAFMSSKSSMSDTRHGGCPAAPTARS